MLIRDAMNSGIHGALSAIYIFILIGVLIAAFIESGTLATLICFGIEFIGLSVFSSSGMGTVKPDVSVATGTSW